MRIFVAALSLSGCATVSLFGDRLPEVKSEYDKFRDFTSVSITNEYQTPSPHPTLWVIAAFDGKVPTKKTPSVEFGFAAHNSVERGWHYLQCYQTALLVDGERLSLDTKHDGRVGTYISEYVTASIPMATLNKIAFARSVEVKICDREFSLSDDERAALKTLAQMVSP